MSIVLGILTFALIVLSLFLVLIVLAQKAKSDGGVGAAMGGGMTEAAFGADTGNVLSKATIYAAIAFFVIAFSLYLGRIYERKHAHAAANNALPTISVPAAPAPAPAATTTAAPVTVPVTAPAAAPAATTPAPEAAKKP
jgi:preprotein translocase subunit SecG